MTLPRRPVLIYHDDASDADGTGRYVAALVRGLEAEGCEVVRVGGAGWGAPGLFHRLRGVRQSVRPGIIHVHGVGTSPAVVLGALRGAAPVVFTVHRFRTVCPTGRGIRPSGRECVAAIGGRCLRDGCLRPVAYALHGIGGRITAATLARWVDRTIAPSLAMWRALEERRIRSHYLPHFVECDRARTPIPFGSPPEILFVAPVRREDARVLFAAMRIVLRAVEGVTLRVVGDGSALREDAAREGVASSVRFEGVAAEGELERRFLRSSVVVFPTTVKENCPPLLLEAMAHERPVVASRSGGIPELVEDGENGFLVRPADPEGLAKALLGVLLDGDRAREMGGRGKRRVRARFSGDRHVREILKIYRELLWDADRG